MECAVVDGLMEGNSSHLVRKYWSSDFAYCTTLASLTRYGGAALRRPVEYFAHSDRQFLAGTETQYGIIYNFTLHFGSTTSI